MDMTATTTTAGLTTTTKVTPIPTCYTPATPPIECSIGGVGSAKEHESRRVLLLCLRGIAAFCWAASRRTLERMILAYLQSAVANVNPTWPSLFASLTAPRGVPTCDDNEAKVLRNKEGGTGGAACANQKKVFWSYLRGAFIAV
jgi:hypothetical protein